MLESRKRNAKILSLVIGVGAIGACAAMTVGFDGQSADGVQFQSSTMQTGVTVTQTTPAAVEETSLASPTVKATPFGGAGQ